MLLAPALGSAAFVTVVGLGGVGPVDVSADDGDVVALSIVLAVPELARRPENKGKTIVTLLPDTGDRYLSTRMFAE